MNSRDFESLAKKRINAKWSIIFNRACLKENIMPKYVQNIYIYKSRVIVFEIELLRNG